MVDNRTQHEQSNTGGEATREREKPGSASEATARQARAAIRSTAEAGSDAVRQGAVAAEESGRSTGEALRRGGDAAAEAVQRASETGAQFVHQAGDAAGATMRRSGEIAASGQREFVHSAAGQLEHIGRHMAEAAQDTADDLRSLVALPSAAGVGLRDFQQGMTAMVESVVATNLRATQELLQFADPRPLIDLQRRFVRDYLGALLEGSATVARTVRRSADQTLRPLEDQIERRRGQGQAHWAEQSRRAQRGNGKVADVMSTNVRMASPDDTVQQAARLMREEDTGVLPVGEGDRLIGMVTDRDVALRVAAEGKNPAQTKVREVMTPEVRYVFEDEDLGHVAENMAEQQLRRMPVVSRNKRLVGILSLSDISRNGRPPHLAGEALRGITREGGMHHQSAAAE
jgi:CBS domain-containing protein